MLSNDELMAALVELEIPVAGAIVAGYESQVSYVFVSITRDAENKQRPSNLKLSVAREKLAESGVVIEFLLVDANSQEIEAGLRATIRHFFDREIRNVFLSRDGCEGKVWVEPKINYDEKIEKLIEEKAKIYLSQFNIDMVSVVRTAGENIPTIMAILNRIRQLAPVTQSALSADIISRGFSIPSDDWLKRRLDSMRRNGRIVRLGDGAFVLTLSSLRALGTARGRSSPDVTRMLALARRGG